MKRTIVLGGRSISYELERKKVKNINLRIRPDGSVYVSASRLVPVAYIESFIRSREELILKALDKAAESPTPAGGHSYVPGELFPYFGEWFPLAVREGGRSSVKIAENAICVTVKPGCNAENIKKALDSFYRRECERAVQASCGRIYPFFSRRGIEYPEIKYRKMKSKWGSCRPTRKELTFNTALAYTPVECVDYVVAHEFCHFIHADHSKYFYAELEKVIPDWKERRRLLNTFGSELG